MEREQYVMEPQEQSQRWLGWAVFASWLALDVLIIGVVGIHARWGALARNSGPADEWVAIVLTLLLAQMGFAGQWLVFGPGPLALRLPAVVGNFFLTAAAFLRFVADKGALEKQILLFFLVLLGAFQVAVLIPLILVRRSWNLEARWSDETQIAQPNQFRLIDIFAWMFAAAVLTLAIRGLLGKMELNDNFQLATKDFITLGLFVCVGMIQPLLGGAALAGPATIRAWLKLAVVSLVCSGVCAAPALLLGNALDAVVLTVIFFGQFVLLSFYLALLRLAGLKLVSVGKKSSLSEPRKSSLC